MGCDIHLHVEIKVDGQWHHYSQPQIWRNYNLFARMAGVRAWKDSKPTIAEPRGFPEDASFTTRLCYEKEWGPDAHTPSWLSSEEIAQLHREFAIPGDIGKCSCYWCDAWGYLFGNRFTDWFDYPEEREDFIDDWRAVFWFDN